MLSALRAMLSMAGHNKRRPDRSDAAINQRLFETSLDLILVVDRQGNFIRVSPSSYTILGYRPEEMVGKNAILFLSPEDLENTRTEMRQARRGKEMRNFGCRYVHRDGHDVPLYWTGVWSEPEQQHFFIGRDMTERNAQEERLRRSQRLEAVGQLTGGIAHDFNNLLAIVVGNLDLLEGRVGDDPEARGFVDSAMQACLRGSELTRQLLAFGRRQSLKAEIFDMNARVTGAIELMRHTLGEGIEITTVLMPDLWLAHADPGQLDSALLNLAINARDAMQGNGRLTIETENKHLDEEYCHLNSEVMPGDYVMVAISDTGHGMPPDVLARVFEPFFTTKQEGKGSGLGLSMVYGFARQSRGHVKIYSEAGHGATVRLYLPRAPEDAVAKSSDSRAATHAEAGGETILVVEDNPQVREVVVAQLRSLGYRVVETENGSAALRSLERGDPVDLVFSDIVMPGQISGLELASAAKKLRPGLKVLLTSGFAKGSMRDGANMAGADGFIDKPYRKADLAAKLRAILDHKP